MAATLLNECGKWHPDAIIDLFWVRTGEPFLIIAGVDALVLSMIFAVAGAILQLITHRGFETV